MALVIALRKCLGCRLLNLKDTWKSCLKLSSKSIHPNRSPAKKLCDKETTLLAES